MQTSVAVHFPDLKILSMYSRKPRPLSESRSSALSPELRPEARALDAPHGPELARNACPRALYATACARAMHPAWRAQGLWTKLGPCSLSLSLFLLLSLYLSLSLSLSLTVSVSLPPLPPPMNP